MDEQSQHEKDDWAQLTELEQEVGEDGVLDPAEWGEFLLRVGPMVGLAPDECQEAMATARGAGDLVRRARRLVDEASERFRTATLQLIPLRERGKRYEAIQVMRELLDRETVWFYRQLVEEELKRLARMRLIAEREYRFVYAHSGAAGKVTVRVGAPEQDTPSDWVLRFEILGPLKGRTEHVVRTVDALQALCYGLQRIVTELRCLQESAGGTLTFLDEEGLGLGSMIEGSVVPGGADRKR